MQWAPARCPVAVAQASVQLRGPQRILVRSGLGFAASSGSQRVVGHFPSGARRALVHSGLWSAASSGSQRAPVRAGAGLALQRCQSASVAPWVLRSLAASYCLQRLFEGAAPQLQARAVPGRSRRNVSPAVKNRAAQLAVSTPALSFQIPPASNPFRTNAPPPQQKNRSKFAPNSLQYNTVPIFPVEKEAILVRVGLPHRNQIQAPSPRTNTTKSNHISLDAFGPHSGRKQCSAVRFGPAGPRQSEPEPNSNQFRTKSLLRLPPSINYNNIFANRIRATLPLAKLVRIWSALIS